MGISIIPVSIINNTIHAYIINGSMNVSMTNSIIAAPSWKYYYAYIYIKYSHKGQGIKV